MDFDLAARRLDRDQRQSRARQRPVQLSVKAQRDAAYRKEQQEKLAQKRQREQQVLEYKKSYMSTSEVHVRSVLGSSFVATSIYGDGDKIALPPSVLEKLTSNELAESNSGNPWIFRIGILNPDYKFPASPLVQAMEPPVTDNDMQDSDSETDSDMEDEDDRDDTAAYLDELSHKYLSYTHGTVVEFTQEEGHVGIPQSVATALLKSNTNSPNTVIPTTRTKDPAGISDSTDDEPMSYANDAIDNTDEEKTPGHLAWGAFDVPDMPLEISLVKLPKAKASTLTPTHDAIMSGFYNLKDIKLVLEQSLIRTRATISLNDTVHTWFRGVKYDLTVTSVKPSIYQAVVCINTDMEVEFGQVDETVEANEAAQSSRLNSDAEKAGKGTFVPTENAGRTLGSSTAIPSSADTAITATDETKQQITEDMLKPEPPADQKENVCTVQIRSGNSQGRRRFDIAVATVHDLMFFASYLRQPESGAFQLVTRFPRRVLHNDNETVETTTLANAGIQAGQELFLVETL